MGMGPMLMLGVGAVSRVRCPVECGRAILESVLFVLCTPPVDERVESERAQQVAIAAALCAMWAVLCMCDHCILPAQQLCRKC